MLQVDGRNDPSCGAVTGADRLAVQCYTQNGWKNVLQGEVHAVLGRFTANDIVEGGLARLDQGDGTNVLRRKLRSNGQIYVEFRHLPDLDVVDLDVAEDLICSGVHLIGEGIRTR